VAERVFFHVGLPKTGTTYLQTILWNNRDELLRQGILLPGFGPRQHLWASGVVREEPDLTKRHADAPQAWDVLVGEVNAHVGTAVVSHEFFAAASAEQAARAVAALGDAEVHVVLTARDTLSLVTARWQEFVKNGSTVPVDGYPVSEETDPRDAWDWGSLDVADVLRRWSTAVPPERVHVLTLPKPSEPRETLWLRFADLLGIDAARCDASGSEANESLGVVEVELLRRVNADLTGFGRPLDRGVWIRGYLAQGKLVPRRGEKFWPSPERVAELRARGDRAVDEIAARGYDVIGDLADLRTPADVPERRHPSSVTDAELVDAAAATIAAMLTDVRQLTHERDRARRGSSGGPDEPGRPTRLVKNAARRALRLWRRSQTRSGRDRHTPG
jgi:hypothetical protein